MKDLSLEIEKEIKQLDLLLVDATEYKDIFLIKKHFYSKNGSFMKMQLSLKGLPPDERKKWGVAFNEFRNLVQKKFEVKIEFIKQNELFNKFQAEKINLNSIIQSNVSGHYHPLLLLQRHLTAFMQQYNFQIYEHKIVESNINNFDNLNIDEHHPSRASHDTFYVDDGIKNQSDKSKKLLATHCTNDTFNHLLELGQDKTLKEYRAASFGKVFRNDDDDATHSHQFFQLDAVCLAQYNVTCAHLKQFLIEFFKFLFGSKIKLRFRISYFPFTEPSFEVDVSCIFCDQKGCRVCTNKGWLETLGCGMISKYVLQNANLDSDKWQGFAFGVGLERLAMLKWKIKDIREFYTQNFFFLKQF